MFRDPLRHALNRFLASDGRPGERCANAMVETCSDADLQIRPHGYTRRNDATHRVDEGMHNDALTIWAHSWEYRSLVVSNRY